MAKTAIVTDTNSGLNIEDGRKLGVYVLPMPVIIENETFTEGMDITHQQLYTAMREKKNISSSQPSPGDVMNLWDRVLSSGYDDLVYIPMSSGLSGSCQTALGLAENYDGRVQVADNHRISLTQYLSVLDAKHLADQGQNAIQIRQALELHAMEASIYIMVDSLEYLKRSGRVTAAAAAFATALNLKPVLTIQGDKLDAFAKVRGNKHGERCMLEAVRKDRETRFKDFPDSELIVAAASTFDDPQQVENWQNTVRSHFPEFKFAYMPLSCSIASHTGVNAAGTGICRIL